MPSTHTKFPRNLDVKLLGVTCLAPKLQKILVFKNKYVLRLAINSETKQLQIADPKLYDYNNVINLM